MSICKTVRQLESGHARSEEHVVHLTDFLSSHRGGDVGKLHRKYGARKIREQSARGEKRHVSESPAGAALTVGKRNR
jgi:hypothetical protein